MVSQSSFESLLEVLTAQEDAQLLRCSKAHFGSLLNGGIPGRPRIPSVRLGRRRFVREATLSDWFVQFESNGAAR